MFKFFGTLIKLCLFSLGVLALGNWIRWNGRTISDQVRIGMAHAEKSNIFESFKTWTETVTRDARQGALKKPKFNSAYSDEGITSSERQKLKALIKELNSLHKPD